MTVVHFSDEYTLSFRKRRKPCLRDQLVLFWLWRYRSMPIITVYIARLYDYRNGHDDDANAEPPNQFSLYSVNALIIWAK
jgi:hypothetical protein